MNSLAGKKTYTLFDKKRLILIKPFIVTGFGFFPLERGCGEVVRNQRHFQAFNGTTKKNLRYSCYCLLLVCLFGHMHANGQAPGDIRIIAVDSGWAANSVNTTPFRKNSLASYSDTQFIAFYNQQQYVVLGKRKQGTDKWLLKQTPFKGNAADAHNSISIIVDGEGYLHVAWDHHNNPLNYCRSIFPGSLELTPRLPMTGSNEQRLTYPEFYKMPGGNILFFYRNGQSGNGSLVINEYNIRSKNWSQIQTNLVDGEGKRNGYWQACTDNQGTIHISWVWRESPDVASNHDLCYARSRDGGKTWENSTGEIYSLPINAASAEYICRIPQKSELINQASMVADESGHPFIATYWKEKGDTIPQYHVVYNTGNQWKISNPGFRKTAFSLSGTGTKRIPIARPQVIAWHVKKRLCAAVIFRDAERGDKASAAICSDMEKGKWQVTDLTSRALGNWEPSYDTEWWKEKGVLNLFIQYVVQADAEGDSGIPPQLIEVLEWKPKNKPASHAGRNRRSGRHVYNQLRK